MDKIRELFANKRQNILSVYVTAGFPDFDSTADALLALQEEGVDMVELGIPFSDPLADGPVIQKSSQKAIENGMTLKKLFAQLEEIKPKLHIPVLLMGYFNSILNYGVEDFCTTSSRCGVSGAIIPDLPLDIYLKRYVKYFKNSSLSNIFLISPETSEDRIRLIDEASDGFIYLVSKSSTTGSTSRFNDMQIEYFKRIRAMELKNPGLIGFGIHNHETFNDACNYSSGAIIGTAYIRALEKGNVRDNTISFVKQIRNN